MGTPVTGSARCPYCQQPVDWVNAATAARIIGTTERYVRQLISDGRLHGAVKYKPPGGEPAFWKIPLTSVAAYLNIRNAR